VGKEFEGGGNSVPLIVLSLNCTVLCRRVTDLSRDQAVLGRFLVRASFKFNDLAVGDRFVIPVVAGSSPVSHPKINDLGALREQSS